MYTHLNLNGNCFLVAFFIFQMVLHHSLAILKLCKRQQHLSPPLFTSYFLCNPAGDYLTKDTSLQTLHGKMVYSWLEKCCACLVAKHSKYFVYGFQLV